ncbi:MAG: Ulp1 family isopeptidase [Methylomonas sp.]|jgi:hypothetical protein|uniref:Ulp1 family isopeptidase n=1 Tax=Methylomonas sp. TaxID=418 RepID=UPI0025E14C42|nr:Ulp1 family isopeptidase [Methylomonas sp.]MCK9607560.1 Ulp1 family isopeptidase [Methylomonas sp.]
MKKVDTDLSIVSDDDTQSSDFAIVDVDEEDFAIVGAFDDVDDEEDVSPKNAGALVDLKLEPPILYDFPKDKAAKKDATLAKLIPENISTVCALTRDEKCACLLPSTIEKIGDKLGIVAGEPQQIAEKAKETLHCEDGKCVLNRMKDKIDAQTFALENATAFKRKGPVDVKLLNNYDIDDTLNAWSMEPQFARSARASGESAGFFAYNFNMRDYEQHSIRDTRIVNSPDSLATTDWRKLYAENYRTSACVINSDNYSGGGKHWMALFVDTRDENPKKWSIEFFNSAGNNPAPEWVKWMIKTRDELAQCARACGELKAIAGGESAPRLINVCRIRHQHSRTECGVYSLFYIWARLHGVPADYFLKTPVPDQLMFEFRQHLFGSRAAVPSAGFRGKQPAILNANGAQMRCKFDYDKFKQLVKIEWE